MADPFRRVRRDAPPMYYLLQGAFAYASCPPPGRVTIAVTR